jgi:hypothetical protein
MNFKKLWVIITKGKSTFRKGSLWFLQISGNYIIISEFLSQSNNQLRTNLIKRNLIERNKEGLDKVNFNYKRIPNLPTRTSHQDSGEK